MLRTLLCPLPTLSCTPQRVPQTLRNCRYRTVTHAKNRPSSRGHHRRFQDSGYIHDLATRVVTLPCWQLLSAFGHRIAIEDLGHIGIVVFIVCDGKLFEPRRCCSSPSTDGGGGVKVTTEEVLAELQAAVASDGPDDAFTTPELCEILGLGEAMVGRLSDPPGHPPDKWAVTRRTSLAAVSPMGDGVSGRAVARQR